MNARRQLCRGVTLIELMIVILITAVLAGALGYAFTAGLDMERATVARQADVDRTREFEERLTTLLKGAMLSATETDATSFFIGESSSDGGDLGSDTLLFTTIAPGVPESVRASGDDFETQQAATGPIGGMMEVGLGLTPVGDAGDRAGLFERTQRPSDGDPDQGGTETVLDSEIAEIGFRFWDGTAWTDTWDTTTGERRLPAAVQVQYRREGDPEDDIRVLQVTIPASDIDAQNPMEATL